jgi:glycosyltransferase involved in cell wall biosynthesis
MSNHDLIEKNETNKDSKGGTELLQHRLYDGSVPRELLEQFQIVFSRVRELDPKRKHIFYAHDLPEDPESSRFSDPMFRKKFDKFVFVSNWQLEQYSEKRGVKYQESTVIKNSIDPIDIGDKLTSNKKKDDKIRLIYHSTPHRGLDILVPVFVELAKNNPNVVLDVYSSFKLYGWEQRDEHHKQTFEICKNHKQINYHGTVPNDELRKALVQADIFAYPSIWKETSCLCLIEAMSAGVLCVHPNLAALPETSMGLTWMYQWQEDMNAHANAFYQVLQQAVNVIRTQREEICADLRLQKIQVDRVHNWKAKAAEWSALLQSLKDK